MMPSCVARMVRSGLRSALVASVLAAGATLTGPAAAQSAAPPAIENPSPLPYTIRRVHRDASGQIVPDTRPAPEVESYESAPVTLPRSAPPARVGRVPSPSFEPEDLRLAELAHQRQIEISRILAEERLAKRRGVEVNAQGLTPREEFLIHELRRTDREVRAHELAHYFTGRPYTAEPEYWFVVGPLGKRYAVAGHVQFDFSPIKGDAHATLKKFETLRRAALAPAQPSTFDLRIAMELDHSIADLRAELVRRRATARLGQ